MKRIRVSPSVQAAHFLLAAAIVLLAGCASQGGLKNVTQETYGSKPPSQSLVIGNINIKEPKEMGLRMPQLVSAGNSFVLTRTSPAGADSSDLFHHAAWGGDFYLLMDPGKYSIVQITGPIQTLSRSGSVSIPVDLPFEVPENKVIYIGAIEAGFTLTLAGKIEDLKVVVADKYDDAVRKFGAKYPSIQQPVENRSIKMQ